MATISTKVRSRVTGNYLLNRRRRLNLRIVQGEVFYSPVRALFIPADQRGRIELPKVFSPLNPRGQDYPGVAKDLKTAEKVRHPLIQRGINLGDRPTYYRNRNFVVASPMPFVEKCPFFGVVKCIPDHYPENLLDSEFLAPMNQFRTRLRDIIYWAAANHLKSIGLVWDFQDIAVLSRSPALKKAMKRAGEPLSPDKLRKFQGRYFIRVWQSQAEALRSVLHEALMGLPIFEEFSASKPLPWITVYTGNNSIKDKVVREALYYL